MNRARAVLVAILFTLPVVLLGAAGTFALWERGWLGRLAWILPVGWLIGYLLLRGGRRKNQTGWPPFVRLPQWTPRDREIYEAIWRERQAAPTVPASQLSDPQFYLQSALDLATRVARLYHPQSTDPISSLTVLEVLAAAELAMETSASWLRDNVPGSHLMTIRHWRALSQAPSWVRRVSDATWLISLWWNPANLPRWLMSRYATSSATKEIEASVLSAFHQEFLHNVLLHCIELNSGRLRGGAERYRAAIARLRREAGGPPESDATGKVGGDEARTTPVLQDPRATLPDAVRIAVVGQVSAGKSSVINAIRGLPHAACDVLPTTDAIQHYRFTAPGVSEQLELLDTPGYASAEMSPRHQEAIRSAWSRADLVLLVMDVTSPARQADWRLITELGTWYLERPAHKPPPVVGVLTHIDRLSPAMEWQPPYDWRNPMRPKEHSMRAALEYTENVFAEHLEAVIPVCSAADRTYGIEEWLLPALLATLTEAKATLVVRMLHEAEAENLRQLVRQLRGAGGKLLGVFLDWRSNARPAGE